MANGGELYREILYTPQQVDDRIEEMAVEITRRYNSADTLFVCILNGALPFASKLMPAIARIEPEYHPNVQSMIVSRYGKNRVAGTPTLVTDLPPAYDDLSGIQVVLLDDMIDRGGTKKFTEQHLIQKGAKDVECIVLVRKLLEPPSNVEVVMHGFDAPDEFLTGMGMDDARLAKEGNRWAGWIAIANSDA